jgi:hypothetical protein
MSERYLTREEFRYAQISPSTFYESQICALVERSVSALFPGYLGKRCEPYFRTAAGDVQPDLVLLMSDFSGWALVEVEDENHPFRRHILPQISKMTYAVADDKIIHKVWSEIAPNSPKSNVEDALSHRPKVFLVTHGSSEKFQPEIERLGVEAIDVEVHRSVLQPNEYVLVVDDRTSVLTDLGLRAIRSLNPITATLWTITGTLIKEVVKGRSTVEVNVSGTRSFWRVIDAHDGVILRRPSDLSQVDAILNAAVQLDKESGALYLIP